MVKQKQILDVFVAVVSIGVALLVAAGMFSNMEGGGKPLAGWFGWHPVLMTAAFPCLMTMGRWSYLSDDSWGLEGKASRRVLHGSLMGAASVTAIVGYVCIFMAHIMKHSFFGYNFETHKWSPEYWRIFHSIFGYIVLLAMLAQASMGVLKAYNLTLGMRTLTFHGALGKVVIFGGALNACVAALNWGWNGIMRFMVVLLLIVSLLFAVGPLALTQTQEAVGDSQEHQELIEKKG